VFDNALFGFTSPFAGQRYRFELMPSAGSINFLGALADFRRYLWFEPFTLAGRGLHFGRYGMDEEDEAVVGPLYAGQVSLLRGYGYGDLADRCVSELQNTPGENESCLVLDQLFGSRLAVANLELRFPLIRALVLGTGIGFPPVEGFAFFDAGTAWGRGLSPVLATGVPADPTERGILTSAGVGSRVNLLGFAILELGYVRPFAGNRGWHWHVALQPGF
jgi:outer membrane protein assembly factor BamA